MKHLKKIFSSLLLISIIVSSILVPVVANAYYTDKTDTYNYKINDQGKVILTSLEYENKCPEKLVLPNTVDGKPVYGIDDFFLYECDNLKELVIPNTYESLGEYCFYKNPNLVKATLPNTLKAIPYGCFYNCENLEICDIPASCTEICAYAFENTGLKVVTIPEQITGIGDCAFADLKKLETINFNAINCGRRLSNEDFKESSCSIFDDYFVESKTKVTLNIGNKVKSIPDYAFEDAKRIISNNFDLPSSIETIGKSAFYNTGITKFILPETLKEVKEHGVYSTADKYEVYCFNKNLIIGEYGLGFPKTIYCDADSTSYKYANKLYLSTKGLSKTISGNVNYVSTTSTIKITLPKTSGIDGYQIKIDGKTYSSANNIFTVKNLKKNTVYTLYLRSYTTINRTKHYSYWQNCKIATAGNKISVKKIVPGKKQFTAYWKADKTFSGYQIQYSTSKNFKTGTKSLLVKNNITNKSFKKLKSKKTYYFRIRGYKQVTTGNKLYSPWSKIYYGKIK